VSERGYLEGKGKKFILLVKFLASLLFTFKRESVSMLKVLGHQIILLRENPEVIIILIDDKGNSRIFKFCWRNPMGILFDLGIIGLDSR